MRFKQEPIKEMNYWNQTMTEMGVDLTKGLVKHRPRICYQAQMDGNVDKYVTLIRPHTVDVE